MLHLSWRPRRDSDYWGHPEEFGWLCACGHFQGDDLHCDGCGQEPPWGCACCDSEVDYGDGAAGDDVEVDDFETGYFL